MGTVSGLFADWKAWLGSSDPQAPSSAARHLRFVHLLREGGTFDVRPIILGTTLQSRACVHVAASGLTHRFVMSEENRKATAP